ncbi:helix-turn-helix domain-containing protein [Promethearchaeum syntrophicum]|uniref:Helix-turn-helix domain-containing protein n=1 Tax=Promethearchaeum syntrophicum TaxID=2594042 RepID=A0A5B9DE75_9ARCH|nr:helix-turn-helix domain-containing protein [Candidatus Prometheoarchaeum syntrophicum]QEE17100.1 HTH DNA binding domain protein [Candidatus Prometheoarchaeum syntrophicum]
MNDDTIQVKFTFPIPTDKWLANFSRSYPLLQFRLLSMLPISKNQGYCLLQIEGTNIKQFWENFVQFYEAKNYNLIFKDEKSIALNIVMEETWVLNMIVEAQAVLHFPIIIHDGIALFELIASRVKIEQMFNNSNWKKLEISIKQIGQYCANTILTPRQSEILTKALANGFFEIPRRISLSDFAKDFGISATALSGNIRRITQKLGENYLNAFDFKKETTKKIRN